jgi:hypothetical protein
MCLFCWIPKVIEHPQTVVVEAVEVMEHVGRSVAAEKMHY